MSSAAEKIIDGIAFELDKLRDCISDLEAERNAKQVELEKSKDEVAYLQGQLAKAEEQQS